MFDSSSLTEDSCSDTTDDSNRSTFEGSNLLSGFDSTALGLSVGLLAGAFELDVFEETLDSIFDGVM